MELIKSVLSAMHLNWTSVYALPVSVLKDIDRLLMAFLWFGHSNRNCILTSWKNVCRLKEEGGLEIQRTFDCNITSMIRLCWEVETNKTVLWVVSVRRKYLKGDPSSVPDHHRMHRGHGGASCKFDTSLENIFTISWVMEETPCSSRILGSTTCP